MSSTSCRRSQASSVAPNKRVTTLREENKLERLLKESRPHADALAAPRESLDFRLPDQPKLHLCG